MTFDEPEDEELVQCAHCGHTWPVTELDNEDICPDCLLGEGDE